MVSKGSAWAEMAHGIKAGIRTAQAAGYSSTLGEESPERSPTAAQAKSLLELKDGRGMQRASLLRKRCFPPEALLPLRANESAFELLPRSSECVGIVVCVWRTCLPGQKVVNVWARRGGQAGSKPSNPDEARKIGRRTLRSFSQEVWNRCRPDMLKQIGRAKLEQSAAVREAICQLKGLVRVEANSHNAKCGSALPGHCSDPHRNLPGPQ